MRFTRYQPSNRVRQSDGNFYQRGQICQTVISGQRFLHFLNGYRNGSPVWVLLGHPPKRGERANKRPAIQRNAFGSLTAGGTTKRLRQSRPNSLAAALERVEARGRPLTFLQRSAMSDGIEALSHI